MNQLLRIWNSLTLVQRISLILVPAILGVSLWGVANWRKEKDFRPLYTGLAPEDAAAMAQKLRETATEFKTDETGAAILVPSAKVAEARLTLAGAGLPRTGRIGFELFDRTNLGTSDFAEQVNYRRALEGELERTVASLSEVAQARIHITFARDSVFLDSRQPAKATVVLKLKQAKQISKANVTAVANLVSSAVDGLSPDSVAVVSTDGRLLNRPQGIGDSAGDLEDSNFEYRKRIESEYLSKINSALEPVLGAGRYRAGVNVECDFTSTEENNESFDPATSTVVNRQSTEESATGATVGGTPGTAANLPQPPPKAPGTSTGNTRRTESVSFQTGRSVRHSVSPKGNLRRVSAVVLLDQTVRWEGFGAKAKRTFYPPSPEILKGVRDAVAGIVGFNEQRGDSLSIETVPFETTLAVPPPPPPPTPPAAAPKSQPFKFDFKQPVVIGGAAAALLVVLAGAFLLLRRKKRKKVVEVADTAPGALPAGKEAPAEAAAQVAAAEAEKAKEAKEALDLEAASRQAEQARLEAETLNRIKLPVNTKKSEILVRFIRENVQKDPVAATNVLRTWIADTDGKRS